MRTGERGSVAWTRSRSRIERRGTGSGRRGEGSPARLRRVAGEPPVVHDAGCLLSVSRSRWSGNWAVRGTQLPQGLQMPLDRAAGEGLLTPLRSVFLVGDPLRDAWSIPLDPPGRGGDPQVSQVGNAGKPDNEVEYRHRVRARANDLGGFRAKSSFQFQGTLSRSRSGALPRLPASAVQHSREVATNLPLRQTGAHLRRFNRALGHPDTRPRPETGPLLRGVPAALSTAGACCPHRCPDPGCVRLSWRGRRGVRSPGQPDVEECSISITRAVKPSNSPALSTLPAQYRASPHARARCASRRAFQRQPS